MLPEKLQHGGHRFNHGIAGILIGAVIPTEGIGDAAGASSGSTSRKRRTASGKRSKRWARASRCDSVIAKTTALRSSSACVSKRLRWAEISSPMRAIALTEFAEAVSPPAAASPPETTLRWASPSPRLAKAARSNASAIGLRQVLPVQTKVTVSRSAAIGGRWEAFAPVQAFRARRHA